MVDIVNNIKYFNKALIEATWVLLAFTGIGAAAGYFFSRPPFKNPMYKATAKFVVPQSKFLKRGAVGREEYEGFGIGYKPDVRRILAVLQSPETEMRIMDSLRIPEHYGYSWPDESQWKEIIDIYRDNVRFDDPKSNYVLIEVWDESSEFAQKIARTLVGFAGEYWKNQFQPRKLSEELIFSRENFSRCEEQERGLLRKKRLEKRYHYDYMSEAVSRQLDFDSGHGGYDELFSREYRLDVLEKKGAYNDARIDFAREWTGVYDFAGENASAPVETRLSDKPDALEFTLVGALGGAVWAVACVMFIRLIRQA